MLEYPGRGSRTGMKKVSYLIINYNGAKFLDICIQSILSQSWPEREILVCDNGSVDDSEDVCSKFPVRFIGLGANLGIAGAANRGAELAAGDYLFLMNADIKLDPECTRLLAETLDSNPEAFVADPTQYDWDGKNLIHQRTFFERASIRNADLGLYRVRYDGPAQAPVPVPYGCAGCMMMAREKFEKTGGLDPKFFLEWEDADICWRAWRMGFASLYVPAAKVYHYVGFSTDAQLAKLNVRAGPTDRARLASYYENVLRFALKGMGAGLAAIIAVRLLALMPAYLLFRPAAGAAIAAALKKTCLDIGGILDQRRKINKTSKIPPQELLRKFVER